MVLFRIRGVPVKVGWSWLVIFLLVFWSLATALFPVTYPGLSETAYLVMAGVATVLFFLSILAHELSHTLRSLREGVPVRDITLWLFGGVSRADEPLPSPGAEFRVVLAGPLVSAVLAVLFLGITVAGRWLGLPDAIVGVPEYLARINGLLLAFNLVPALPLDGGRLLHSLLWWRSGDSSTATIYAAAAGRAFAGVLVAIGLLSLLVGSAFSGIWLVFLGWFLLQAVRQEVLSARVSQAFGGLRVRDLMTTRLVTVDADMTIEEFADFLGRWPSHAAYPVVADDTFVGMLLLRRAGSVPLRDRASVSVAEVMLTGENVPVLRPDDLVVEAARLLNEEPGRAIVRDAVSDDVVGLLSATDLSRALEVPPSRPRPTTRSRSAAVIGILVAVGIVVGAAAIYHPPFAVVAPGRSFDIRGDARISGVPVQRPTGPYLITAVTVSQPNAILQLVAAFRTDRWVLPVGDVVPTEVTPGAVATYEHRLLVESRETAAVAAARSAGYAATLTGDGAQVLGLVSGSPAARSLEVGDTITEVDGSPVSLANDLHRALATHPVGQTIALTVERGSRTLRVEVENARLPTGGTGAGVLVSTKDPHADVPFRLSFRNRPNLSGPSAGLAYALLLSDMLDPTDDARGRAVAATGTIAPDGAVGPVGAVHEKAIVAEDAGASLFLVPAAEISSVGGDGVDVAGVSSLKEAIAVLAR